MKTILITFLILFIGLNCYADKYDKIQKQVNKYERISEDLNSIKTDGDNLYSKDVLNGSEYVNIKKSYNQKYDKFIETGYMLEEIIIIEGGLTMNDMIVPMSERKGGINDIGRRKYNKTTDEIIVDIDKNLKVLSGYIGEVYSYYGQKQRQKKEEIQRTVR